MTTVSLSKVKNEVTDTGDYGKDRRELDEPATSTAVKHDLENDREFEPDSKKIKTEASQRRECPYLDTINRGVLDFDFEKLCSVSLLHTNVYACLVCGKYFQGRGKKTHAYMHSVDVDHRVFLNLHTLKFYCLPDNYEVVDSALEDITYVLKPTYTKRQIKEFECNKKISRAYDGTLYYPGIVGLNNIKANDYCNVVLHALSHVEPLRSYFLREENYANIVRPPGDKLALLSQRFGELIRKLWNPRNFKAHVSPHEMLQAVVLCSEKRFQITQQGDAVEFMSWLLNALHTALNGTNKTSSSVIYRSFRGRIRIYTRKIPPSDLSPEELAVLLMSQEYRETIEEKPFLHLALDLPPVPLYKDELDQNIIPQVPLERLLDKYNGINEKEYKTYSENFMKRFEIVRLPRYLIMSVKRFTKNNWFVEKNTTIVNFPIRNIDMSEYLAADVKQHYPHAMYDLVANVVHDGHPGAGKGTYRMQLHYKGIGKWFELEDLHVKEILPQTITLTETYIQIYELNKASKRENGS